MTEIPELRATAAKARSITRRRFILGVIASGGVVAAAKTLGIKVPIVVRLKGTNVELGQKILQDSGLNFTVANDMKEAAERVVAAARRG